MVCRLKFSFYSSTPDALALQRVVWDFRNISIACHVFLLCRGLVCVVHEIYVRVYRFCGWSSWCCRGNCCWDICFNFSCVFLLIPSCSCCLCLYGGSGTNFSRLSWCVFLLGGCAGNLWSRVGTAPWIKWLCLQISMGSFPILYPS